MKNYLNSISVFNSLLVKIVKYALVFIKLYKTFYNNEEFLHEGQCFFLSNNILCQ